MSEGSGGAAAKRGPAGQGANGAGGRAAAVGNAPADPAGRSAGRGVTSHGSGRLADDLPPAILARPDVVGGGHRKVDHLHRDRKHDTIIGVVESHPSKRPLGIRSMSIDFGGAAGRIRID